MANSYPPTLSFVGPAHAYLFYFPVPCFRAYSFYPRVLPANQPSNRAKAEVRSSGSKEPEAVRELSGYAISETNTRVRRDRLSAYYWLNLWLDCGRSTNLETCFTFRYVDTEDSNGVLKAFSFHSRGYQPSGMISQISTRKVHSPISISREFIDLWIRN